MGNPDAVSGPRSAGQAGSSAEASSSSSRLATGSPELAPPGATAADESPQSSEEKIVFQVFHAVSSIHTFDPPFCCLHSSLFIQATTLFSAA